MRQVRVQIESVHPVQDPEPIQCGVGLDGRGCPVGCGGGAQAETILHRNTKSVQQLAGEAAKALLRRYGPVAVVVELLCCRARCSSTESCSGAPIS